VVLVVSPRARRAAAELFRRSTPHVPVLSTAELDAADLPGQPVFSWVS
jgi:flagellar biosynthesis component FlhA